MLLNHPVQRLRLLPVDRQHVVSRQLIVRHEREEGSRVRQDLDLGILLPVADCLLLHDTVAAAARRFSLISSVVVRAQLTVLRKFLK